MQFDYVTCPHCGLLCDDLTVDVHDLSVRLKTTNYPVCKQAFEDASMDRNALPSALVNGTVTSLQKALDTAAKLLKKSKQPLISGMIADVQACRNAIALTEKVGGVIDHANGSRIRVNNAIMQRIGEVKTTLSEVRNRADCVVIFGADVLDKFPRLYDRILSPAQSLGSDNTKKKNIFVLNLAEDTVSPHTSDDAITHMYLDAPSLDSLIHKLAYVFNKPANTLVEIDDTTQALIDLHQSILKSQYTTFIWNVADFKLETAEHTVQAITQCIKKLMTEIRCVALPLGGSKAEITASQVATWQTGVPLPVAFMSGAPVHDPNLFDGMKMLQNNEVDALVWIATYSSKDTPPDANIPTIVIGHPNMHCESGTNVFIPTGIPGIDDRGLACRTDSVATLPLKSVRASELIAASEVINQLTQLI